MNEARHHSPASTTSQSPRHTQAPDAEPTALSAETTTAANDAVTNKKMVAGFSRVEHLGLMIGIPATDRYPRRPGFLDDAVPTQKDGRRFIFIEFDSPRQITTPKNKVHPPGRYYGGFVGTEKDGSWKIEGPMTEILEDLQEGTDPKTKTKVLLPRKGSVYRDLETAGANVTINAVTDRTGTFAMPHIVITFPADRVDQVVGALDESIRYAKASNLYANRQEVMVKAINRLRATPATPDPAEPSPG